MLPFMREQGFEQSPKSAGALADPVRNPEGKVSNGAKGKVCNGGKTSHEPHPSKGRDENYLTVAARDKNVRKTTVLLAILTGCGLLCLLFMIKKSTPLNSMLDAPPLGVLAESFGLRGYPMLDSRYSILDGRESRIENQADEIVKKFYEFSDVQQVKVGELVKNPFNLMLDAPPLGVLRRYSMLDSRYSIRETSDERRATTDEMQLLSILHTEQGSCCMIRVPPLSAAADSKGGKMGSDDSSATGKILYEGDKIRGFRVRQISDSFVELESENLQIRLKLSE